MDWIVPTKATLVVCTIGDVPFYEGDQNNFHVQELRIFEDHCKAYFTGQLVIEAHQNVWEAFVEPGAQVVIGFEAPRSDGGPTKTYNEQFRIYSYESKPREGDLNNAMVITLSLIGQEYYNDKQNVVLQSFANIPGTQAAAAIHEQYMAENGGLRITEESSGMVGLDKVPHEVNNKKPIKAIHDILDKCIWAGYPSCAPMYFRDKFGYVIGPLQQLLENAPVVETFEHSPAQGASLQETLAGYNKIIHLRPQSPPGTDQGASTDIDGLMSALSFFDIKSGQYQNNFQSIDSIIGKLSGGFQSVANSMKGGIKGRYGGRNAMAVLDQKHQPLSVAKNGPGGFQSSQESFLAALGFCPKYWISVPLQTGVNVTCGQRINVVYPFTGDFIITKTLYVPRLIHELRFTEGRDRSMVTVNGITDLFCVHWGD